MNVEKVESPAQNPIITICKSESFKLLLLYLLNSTPNIKQLNALANKVTIGIEVKIP